jgi:hypothetical protein
MPGMYSLLSNRAAAGIQNRAKKLGGLGSSRLDCGSWLTRGQLFHHIAAAIGQGAGYEHDNQSTIAFCSSVNNTLTSRYIMS